MTLSPSLLLRVLSAIAPLALPLPASAYVVLGTGSAALLGGDLTDPEDDGNAGTGANFDAIFSANNEAGFGGGEFSYNIFNNLVAGGNAKWCCDHPAPGEAFLVEAEFAAPVVVRSFTLATGDDARPGRDPDVWQIQGSNGVGENAVWTDIYSYDREGTSPFTAANQVLLFVEGEAGYPFQEVAYQRIRYRVESTVNGTAHHLNELELFAEDLREWWYVATDGDDVDNACTDPAAPCATLAGAIAKMTPVDAAPDGITLAAGTFTVASPATISRDMVIRGAGAEATAISGGGAVRVLEVASSVSVTLEDLTVRDGSAATAAGIMIAGSAVVTLRTAIVELNTSTGDGGGILSQGRLIIEGSTVRFNTTTGDGSEGDGAGIYSDGAATLLISDSTFHDNATLGRGRGFEGGAAMIYGAFTIERSTFSGNRSEYGGALQILSSAGIGTITDTTFGGNTVTSADGGHAIDLYGGAKATIGNSLFAANSDKSCAITSSTLTTAGHNLVDDGTCATWFNAASDQNDVEVQLRALRDNGGDTLTMAPAPDGAAIDAGLCSSKFDQRGRPRPVDRAVADAATGNGCDVGAVEVQAASSFYVDPTGDDGNDCLSGGSACATVAAAVAKAEYGDEITLAAGEYDLTSPLSLDLDLVVRGAGLAETVLHGGGVTRVLEVDKSAVVTVEGVSIRDGSAPVGGGVWVESGSDLTLRDSRVWFNEATAAFAGGVDGGGGILNQGTLLIEGGWIEGNRAPNGGRGAGIFNDTAASLSIHRALFYDNDLTLTAGDQEGGAIFTRGPFVVELVTFAGNDAEVGGAITVRDATAIGSITDSTFKYNGGSFGGDAIDAFGGSTVTVTNSLFGDQDHDGTCLNTGSTIQSGGHNLADDASCAAYFIATGELNSANADLGILRSNAGSLENFLPGPDSAARDAGNCATGTDVRGLARPFDLEAAPNPDPLTGNLCDIGAVEVYPLVAPTDLQATAVTSSTIQLAWSDANGDETGFEVERTPGAVTSTSVASLEDGGVSCGVTYEYVVRAVREAELSADSVALEVEAGACPPEDRNLSITLAGGGSGNVTASPGTIDCGGDGVVCAETLADGTILTLTATAATGSSFAGWSGDADCADGELTMSADRACTATFTLDTHDLELSVVGSGNVQSSTMGLDCGDGGVDCSDTLDFGTVVTLEATAAVGWAFTGWSGDVDCTDGELTMTADRTCTATFEVPLFADGFESGATAAWSAAVGGAL